jgi:uncharacterized protein with NRDE domain
MCLILFAYETLPERRLVVAANRDELHARPTLAAHFWQDCPGVLAGRDQREGGTWLGVHESGRFAAVTNFSDPADDPAPRSRGDLAREFLTGTAKAPEFAHALHGPDYLGFNLLLFDGMQLVYTSNRGVTRVLEAGVYGLSNAELGARWPKVMRGRRALSAVCTGTAGQGALLELLADASVPPDDELPHRGRDLDFERRVAPCFIKGPEYGTRASTAVEIGPAGVRFSEQSWGPDGTRLGRVDFELPASRRQRA